MARSTPVCFYISLLAEKMLKTALVAGTFVSRLDAGGSCHSSKNTEPGEHPAHQDVDREESNEP